jgi:hypothetical protein
MDGTFNNEQVSVDIPGTRNFHFEPLEQSLSPTSHYERSRDTVSFSLQSQGRDQDLRGISQPYINPTGHQLNAHGLSTQHENGADLMRYEDATFDIDSLESSSRHWKSTLDGRNLNMGVASETRSELSRSKELSSRMKYKYY